MITILSFVLSGFSFNRVSKTVGKATAKWAVKDRNKDNQKYTNQFSKVPILSYTSRYRILIIIKQIGSSLIKWYYWLDFSLERH